MSTGVFDTSAPDDGYLPGVRPGNDGLDGIGISSIDQPATGQLRLLLTDGRSFTVALPKGEDGDDAPMPTFVIGNVVAGAASSAPAFGFRTLQVGLYAVDLSIPVAPPSWQTPPTAWAASTNYTAAAPASCVTNAGSTYVCAAAHTSGATFDPTKWVRIAGKGDPGNGNVSGPGTATANALVLFNADGSIKDSALQIGTAANNILQLDATARVPSANLTAAKQPVVAKSAAYSFALADLGSLFVFTGSSYTIGAAAPGTLTAGWWAEIRNGGTGKLTFTPGAGVTIDGRTSIAIYPGEAFRIVTDGTNFVSVGRARLVLIQAVTVSSGVASVVLNGISDAELTEVLLEFGGVTLSTASYLLLQTSHGGVLQTNNYSFSELFAYTGAGSLQSINATAIQISGNSAGIQEVTGGTVRLVDIQTAALAKPQINFHTYSTPLVAGAGYSTPTVGGGSQVNTTALFDGVSIAGSSAAITAGTFNLYGRR